MQQIEQEKHLENLNQSKYDNFYIAYDALDKKNKHMLEKGIELAKEVQQAIIQVGTQIIDKKQVKINNGFRYAMLENDYLKDIELF